jgi:TPR repeat protein
VGFLDSIFGTKKTDLHAEGKKALAAGDGRRALEIYSRLAEAGDAEGQCRLAFIYKTGLLDFEKAAFWYCQAAVQGHAEAQCKLGFLYRCGRGVLKDDAEGARWYGKSAIQGNAEAQCNLGRCYLEGEGVSRNIPNAIEWLTRSAEAGYDVAQYTLGGLLAEGTVVQQDIRKGLMWLERVARGAKTEAPTIGDVVAPAGDRNRNVGVNALFTLGQIYRQGSLVGADLGRAFGYYLQAANLGDPESRFIVGMMLYKGDGTQKDVQEAAGWLVAAARQGHAGATQNLGVLPGLLIKGMSFICPKCGQIVPGDAEHDCR